jgi:hypothetical protein
VGQLGQDEPVAEGGQHDHDEDEDRLLLGGAEIHRGRRYLSRRIGRSQNGTEGWSSWPRPRAGWPPRSAGSAGAGAAGFGFGPAPDRCLPLTAAHPLDGQAGPEPPLLPLPPRLPRKPPLPLPLLPVLPVLPVMGGADPAEAERAETREGPEEPEDAARVRGPTGPTAAERPAPRDQPEADPEAPDDPLLPDLGGRSSGGATRSPLLAASGTFLLRAVPAALAPLTTRREPVLVSPSPSAWGGASGRSREAYASLDALATVPARAAASAEAADPAAPAPAPAATPAPAPAATPAATAAAWPGLRRAHRAAR